jgi:hypothetical protein
VPYTVLETVADVTVYDLFLKVIDATLVFALMPPQGRTTVGVVLVSTVDDISVKWQNLVALYTRPDKGATMIRLGIMLCISLAVGSAFGQSAPKYQVGTITEVKIHQDAGGGATGAASYDVSLRVGDTIYVVLYTPPLSEETVKYAAGRDLLVLVGNSTVTYNDILGRSVAVPIESRRLATKPNQSKSVSPAAK